MRHWERAGKNLFRLTDLSPATRSSLLNSRRVADIDIFFAGNNIFYSHSLQIMATSMILWLRVAHEGGCTFGFPSPLFFFLNSSRYIAGAKLADVPINHR